jgi:hypothetical protein
MNRRQYLSAAAGGATLLLAGCVGQEESDREEGSTGGNGDDASSDNGSDGDDPIELLEHEWYMEGQYDAGVRGQAENVSGEELSYVEISVFFLDDEGVQVAESLDNTTDLASGRVWQFDATLFDGEPTVVEDYEIKWEVTNY